MCYQPVHKQRNLLPISVSAFKNQTNSRGQLTQISLYENRHKLTDFTGSIPPHSHGDLAYHFGRVEISDLSLRDSRQNSLTGDEASLSGMNFLIKTIFPSLATGDALGVITQCLLPIQICVALS